MMNETYSYRDFTNHSLVNEPAEAFSGTAIVGSCFYQEGASRQVFPAGATGITFVACNLDNVELPPGTALHGCSHNHIRAIDGVDWFIGEDGEPIAPTDPTVEVE